MLIFTPIRKKHKKAETIFKDADDSFLQLLQDKTVCLLLKEGEETFAQFKSIFPIASTPFVHFIGKQGTRG